MSSPPGAQLRTGRGDPYSVPVKGKAEAVANFFSTMIAWWLWVPEFAGTTPLFYLQPRALKSKKPGLTARAFRIAKTLIDQAAGLNSFEALALIGSTVSVATLWLNSASSLAWAVKASYCLRA